jgi:hypothetical protein
MFCPTVQYRSTTHEALDQVLNPDPEPRTRMSKFLYEEKTIFSSKFQFYSDGLHKNLRQNYLTVSNRVFLNFVQLRCFNVLYCFYLL